MRKNIVLFVSWLLCVAWASGQPRQGGYWNAGTCLETFRPSPPPAGFTPKQIDVDGDGRMDGILSVTQDDIPVLWLDDDADMAQDAIEGDYVNDCLLIDRNKDGQYDFVVKWADLDGDGKADLQLVAEYPFSPTEDVWPQGLYMIVLDTDHDGVFNYIDWNRLRVESWRHYGISGFYPDYCGRSLFLKMHTATDRIGDLRKNWENPFLFYDPDGDGCSEMAVRLLDSPPAMKDKSLPNRQEFYQLTGKIDWVSIAVDLDNDATRGNEFDFDFTLGFSGEGFDYTDQVHALANMRGLPAADKFFPDPRIRQLTELLYPDHASAKNLIFNRGKWNRAFFVFDEDDDCGRWERVEFCDNADPFVAGRGKGGFDNHTQADPAGDRGEWDEDFSGGGKLYVSRFDGRLHLLGAESGIWRIDQDADCFQGWDRQFQRRDPARFATVHYADRDGNGFFDTIEYDLDSDAVYETVVELKDLGLDDRCPVIDPARLSYWDYVSLFERMSSSIWKNALDAVRYARFCGLPVDSYSYFLDARSKQERYYKGWWLAFYLYRDLEHHFVSRKDLPSAQAVAKAFFSGDWSPLLSWGPGKMDVSDPGHCFYDRDDLLRIQSSAKTVWGRQIVSKMERIVEDRLCHDLAVPVMEAGHGHFYVCPIHNQTFTFRWEYPTEHYCQACGKTWSGVGKYDWGWVNFVHLKNRQYMEACSYLYMIKGDAVYADRVRDMLKDYAVRYPGWMVHDAWRHYTESHSGKMFGQSLDEAVWFCTVCRAYDAVKDAIPDSDRAFIEKNLFSGAATLLLARRDFGNWQVWHNAAIASLGVILRDDSMIKTALDDPECGYHYLMAKHVNADGWWNEGSPIYHFYPLEAMVLTAEAVRCRGIDLYDKQLNGMFLAPLKGTYSDLSFPSHNDGWYGESLVAQSGLYEMACARLSEETFRSVLSQCYRSHRRHHCFALFNPFEIEPASLPFVQESHRFADAGFSLLRSGARTVGMKYGPHGGGHGHPDKLSISIHDGRSEIISDFGTSAYGAPDYTRWYRKTLAHNTVCVDGKDQEKVAGRFESFKARKDGGSVRASGDSLYRGVHMERSLDLKGDVLRDVFLCDSPEAHTYDYVLLFNAPPHLIGARESGPVEWTEEPYRQIKDVVRYLGGRSFKVEVDGASVEIVSGCDIEVYLGSASGIPPTNPSVKTDSGSEDRPVIQCHPLVIRTRGPKMEIKAKWHFR